MIRTALSLLLAATLVLPASVATAASPAPATALAAATAVTEYTAKPAAVDKASVIGWGWANGAATLTIDWAAAARATSYEVYASTDYDAVRTMAKPTKVVTSSKATIGGLKPATRYYVVVRAVNNVGHSGFSSRVNHFTPPTEKAAGTTWQTSKPADMGTVKAIGGTWTESGATLTFDWAAVTRATFYRVFVSTDPDAVFEMDTPTKIVTSSKATIGGLKAGTKYTARVVPSNNVGNGGGAPRVSATTLTQGATWQKTKPARVGLVSFTGASLKADGATLTVDWGNVARASSYQVYVSTSYSGVMDVKTPKVTTTSSKAVLRKLKPGKSYFVRVVAVNNIGRGLGSSRVGHTTIADEAQLKGGEPRYAIMSWNVCSAKCSNISGRTRLINTRIKELKADVVGLQEASRYKKAPKGYKFAVNGQNDILYRASTFSKVGKKNGVATTGSKRFASKYASSGHGVAWAALKHESGRYLVVFDTHLVVGKSRALTKQRQYEADRITPYVKAVMRKLAAANPKLKGAATVVIGDFNTNLSVSGDKTMSILKGDGWTDAFMQARSLTRQHHNTANPDKKTKPVIGIKWGSHVDMVWVKAGRTVITSWQNAGKMSGSRYVTPLPSDHHPILVKGVFT